jgi:hypothetical protein
LCDNEIVKLEGFPPLKRLSTLLVHNNRIARIGAGLGGALPRRFRFAGLSGVAGARAAALTRRDAAAQSRCRSWRRSASQTTGWQT